jgi:hypothetical protein
VRVGGQSDQGGGSRSETMQLLARATISITLDTYSHAIPAMQEEEEEEEEALIAALVLAAE